MKKKALVGIFAIGAVLGMRECAHRMGHKPCAHCGKSPCACGHAASESA